MPAQPVRILVAGVAGLSLIFALMAVLVIWLGPEWLTHTHGLNLAQQDEARGRVRTALLALLAGGITFLGAVYTARTFALSRRGQIAERFTRAIDQLGRPEIGIRLGGIYALERIAQESREDHGPIMEVLTAYIREAAPWRPPSGPPGPPAPRRSSIRAHDLARLGLDISDEGSPDPDDEDAVVATVDVRAIMAGFVRRNLAHEKGLSMRFDLSATNLGGVEARGIELQQALLMGAYLQAAKLSDAQLQKANLAYAQLQEAYLVDAQLQNANLAYAQLQEAVLDGARLQRTFLRGAQLGDAHLADAQLQGAKLPYAQLQGASLDGAQLQGAILDGAQLQGASLDGAQLQGASLDGAQLQGATLDGASLTNAEYTEATIWPADFDPRVAGATLVPGT